MATTLDDEWAMGYVNEDMDPTFGVGSYRYVLDGVVHRAVWRKTARRLVNGRWNESASFWQAICGDAAKAAALENDDPVTCVACLAGGG